MTSLRSFFVADSPGRTSRARVVVIGCGFGGLAAARRLARAGVDVTIVDRENHHLFQPLLYQVATAGLSGVQIAAPIRHLFRGRRNVGVLLAEAVAVNTATRQVLLDRGDRLEYDYLVVATGATHSYFGHPEWAHAAPGLKTLDDALVIRRRVLLAFERAEREQDEAARRACLTFVVVGGGPTGVELAGTIAEIARQTLADEFRHIDPRAARVLLLEGGERLLLTYPPDLSDQARAQLERLGVEVRLRSPVRHIDDDGVEVGSERIEAGSIVWAAGVAASPLGASLGTPRDRAGRVQVASDLSLPDHPEVFVIGDLAAATSDDRPVPGVAPAAKQMGEHAAASILARIDGRATDAFVYKDRGTLATIGRNAAVAELGRLKLSGKPAWLAWLFIHIYFLIGFRNRLGVLFD
jgi:NADH dehydrogenase